MQLFSLVMWKAESWTKLFGICQHFMHMSVIMSRWNSHHICLWLYLLYISWSFFIRIILSIFFINVIGLLVKQCSEGFMHTRMRRRVESLIQVENPSVFAWFITVPTPIFSSNNFYGTHFFFSSWFMFPLLSVLVLV